LTRIRGAIVKETSARFDSGFVVFGLGGRGGADGDTHNGIDIRVRRSS
jgi:hypothetical protein